MSIEINSEDFKKLQNCIVDVLNLDAKEITPDSRFSDDLGADSLDVFQIIMNVEEEFGIEIPETELEGIVTVGDALKAIKDNLN